MAGRVMPSAEWWGGFVAACALFGCTLAIAELLYARSADYPPAEEDPPADDVDVIDMHEFAERNHHQGGG